MTSKRVKGTPKNATQIVPGDVIIAVGNKGHANYIPEDRREPVASLDDAGKYVRATLESGDQMLLPKAGEIRVE